MSTDLSHLQASDLIGSPLKISVKDGRVLTGVLLALDNKPNLLVNNVIESCKGKERDLGLVSIPFTSLVEVKILTSELEKTAQWKSKLI